MRSASPPARHHLDGVQVFFLIGAERSGTTLLRLMLNHHPAIACLGEFNLAFEGLNEDGSEPDRETYHKRLNLSRTYRYSGVEVSADLDCREAIPALLEALHRKDGTGKHIVGASIHARYLEALRYWPELRFIHLVRDPRDVAPSAVAMGWIATCWHATELWLKAESAVEDLRKVLPADRIASVRFEDLVSQPEQELTRLCALLGVEYDARMLSYPEDSTYSPPDPSAASRWRKRMPRRDVREVEARAAEVMQRRGYELSGIKPLRMNTYRRAVLAARNRFGRFRARLNTYGPGVLLQYTIARRFDLAEMERRATLKIQDIDQKNLR